MADRFLELRQTSQMRKLTREEQFEFDALQRAKNAAAQDPQLRQAKAEAEARQAALAHQAAIANDEREFQRIFGTVMEFGGKKFQALDNAANRKQIYEFINPGEQIRDAVEWFKQILAETPALAQKLAWTPYLTPGQQILQRKEDQQRLRERFELAAKTHGLAISDANFSIWSSVSDPVISVFNGQPVIVLEDGTTLELVPATQEVIDQWAEDARQKAFQAKQDKLKRMRDTNDLAGLRAAAKAEREERYSPQSLAAITQQKVYDELRNQYAKDSQAGYWEALPSVFTKKVIYSWNAAEMREKVGRYGPSRVTARIHGLSSIPDGNGGTINFE